MKTFRQLCIGDVFYKVYTNYQGKEKPTFETVTIKRIEEEIDKEKFLVLNKRGSGYGDFQGYRIPVDQSDTNKFIMGSDGYFTTEQSCVIELLRSAALTFISGLEREIEGKEKEIKRIRLAYWDYLNKTETNEP